MSLLTTPEPSSQPQGQSQTSSPSPSAPTTSLPPSPSSWRDSLPEDIKNHSAISQYEDVGALAKSYINAQSLIGKKGVIVPSEKASPEDWSNFYKQLGQPDLEKFEIKLPEGTELNPEVLNQFKDAAFKSGLLPKQAQGLLEWYTKFEKDTMATLQSQKQQSTAQEIDSLKKEWGDGFQKQVALAQMAVKELGGEGFVKYLVDSGLASNVPLTKFMAQVGKLLGEDKLRGEGVGAFGKTPQELDAEIQAMFESPAFMDKNHGGHAKAMQQWEALQKQRWGA